MVNTYVAADCPGRSTPHDASVFAQHFSFLPSPSTAMEITSTSSFQAISSKPHLLKRRSHNFYGAKSRSLISMPADGLPPCRSPLKYNFARGITSILYSSRRNTNFTARASTDDGNFPQTASPSSSNSQIIIISSAVTVTLAIANRVLYKLALVPMKQYPFFLAQITTFG